jgi:hypothetical protein
VFQSYRVAFSQEEKARGREERYLRRTVSLRN